ncbi:MAG: tetratricopeptide repeat protein [Candidatus Babeliales bacterium]
MTGIDQNFSLDHIQDILERNMKSLVAAALVGAILIGAYYYVRVYRVEQDARAHTTLTEVLAEVTRAGTRPEAWQDVEVAARTAYHQHSSSDLAPYFLAIEAGAFIEQGKIDQGREQLKNALASMPKKAPLTDFYALKLARLELNTQDDAIRKEGLASLEKLAQDSKSLVHDEALYRLGKAYAQERKTDQARKVFDQLVTTYKESKEPVAQSVWAGLAQEQIDRLA